MTLPELILHLKNIEEVCQKKGIPTNTVSVDFVDRIIGTGEDAIRSTFPFSNVQLINGKVYLYHPTSFHQLQEEYERRDKEGI